jgi:hypothetical protein
VGVVYRRREAHRRARLPRFDDFRDLRKLGLGEVLR